MYLAKTRAFSALLLFLACASTARAEQPILTTSIAPGTITGVAAASDNPAVGIDLELELAHAAIAKAIEPIGLTRA